MRDLTRFTCMALLLCLAFPPGTVLAAKDAAAPAPAAVPDSLPPPAARAWQTGLLRPDRLEHASLAFTLGLGIGLLSRRPALAAAGALGLGLAKEVRDRRHGGFDAVDLASDALGAAAAALATRPLTR